MLSGRASRAPIDGEKWPSALAGRGVAAWSVPRWTFRGSRLETASLEECLVRVLVVVHGFPPAAQGGSEIYAFEHARTLQQVMATPSWC